MNPYIQRMVDDMKIRNFSDRTIDSYTWHVDKFCQYFGKRPKTLPMVFSDQEAGRTAVVGHDPESMQDGHRREPAIRGMCSNT
jgi:hypothetical protein